MNIRLANPKQQINDIDKIGNNGIVGLWIDYYGLLLFSIGLLYILSIAII